MARSEKPPPSCQGPGIPFDSCIAPPARAASDTNELSPLTATKGDTETYMALAYYAMGDAGLTLRYTTGEYAGKDFDKYTVSPSYAFSDSVFGLVEASLEDIEGASDSVVLAAELIFSF